MRNNKKYKNSSHFLFWLGFSPFVAILVVFIIIAVGVFNKYRPSIIASKVVENKQEVICDTLFIECKKRHLEDVSVTTKSNQEKRVETTEVSKDSVKSIIDTLTTNKK